MNRRIPVKKETALMLAVFAIGISVIALMISFYRNIMEDVDVNTTEMSQVYQYQYEMIVDSRNIGFWQSVYEIARQEALKNNAVLTLNGTDWGQDYDKEDFMDMSIAEQADGIILEYNGEENLEEKINEAVEKGIPVVTVVNDAPRSLRQSFVGINDYQLGQATASRWRT